MNKFFAVPLALAVVLSAPLAVAADVKKGEKVFKKKCRACHYVKKDRNKTGPTLQNIFGRTAGTNPKFKYSKAMKASGIVWDETSFTEYMKNPRGFIKGTKMSFKGLKKDPDIQNLIAYLKTFSQ